jgi:hypothetical protein
MEIYHINSPSFQICLRLICDFFYCVFLLLGFRLQVEFVFTENHRDGPPEYRDRSYWSLSTWALAFYFLVKDLLSLLSLYMTATKLAKRYCTSVYNFVDTAAVLILVVEGGPGKFEEMFSFVHKSFQMLME